jgi:hypothetical protein
MEAEKKKIEDTVLSNKDYYTGNGNIKKAGVEIQYSQDQIDELVKCSNDPVYFIKNYVKIVTLDKGLTDFDMYDFQERIVSTIHDNRFTICKIPRQSGKCVETNTLVTVRNKKTGNIEKITVGNLFDRIQNK